MAAPAAPAAPAAKRARCADADEVTPERLTAACPDASPHASGAAAVGRMLTVIEDEILPKTARCVAEGNKVFGAAVLRDAAGLPTVIADTNHEMLCPMYHGEVYTIKQWSETVPAADRPSAAKSVFLSTHEPCCMCVSAIVWAGFRHIHYLFPYETTRDQGIPHDLNIMHQLWGVERYRPRNEFCRSTGILDQIGEFPDAEAAPLRRQYERITARYADLSQKYHAEKAGNEQNTLAFD